MFNGLPQLYACARAAAWAASVNFGFVALSVLSPVFQLLYQYFNFNIMHHSLHTIHFHRNAALCGSIFALMHIGLAVAQFVESHCKIEHGGKDENICTQVKIISGGFICLGFVGAWISGHLGRFKLPSVVSSFHLPFAFLGFMGMFAHAHGSLDFPFGTYFVLTIFAACAAVYTLFFFFNPIQPMEVNVEETVWQSDSNKFLFLVLNYDNSASTPPGSFYLLYDTKDSNLSYFHAHPFPVFSSRNRQLVFLVRCRIPTHPERLSFTQRLSLGKYPLLQSTILVCAYFWSKSCPRNAENLNFYYICATFSTFFDSNYASNFTHPRSFPRDSKLVHQFS